MVLFLRTKSVFYNLVPRCILFLKTATKILQNFIFRTILINIYQTDPLTFVCFILVKENDVYELHLNWPIYAVTNTYN